MHRTLDAEHAMSFPFTYILECGICKLMKRIIQFHVFKGERQYVAEGIDLPVVTQGKTLDELAANIQEATEAQLED